jgi:hypothetical protein
MSVALAAPPAVAADLVLVRMALPARRPPGPAAIRKDVGRLLHGRDLSAEEFTALRDELAAAGLVTATGRSVGLADGGRARAMAYLGISEFPPRATWKTVLAKFLFPRAVGLPPEVAERMTSKDRLAAQLLKLKYDLPDDAGSKVGEVIEALACRTLRHPEETTLDGLMRRTICREVLKTGERLTKKELIKQLPLYETGLIKGTADEIRQALIRAALNAEPEPPAEFDLTAFARTIQVLARTSPPEDRFHDNKVYIAALWRVGQREAGFPRMTLPVFKARLVEANQAGLLRLSRADLVQAMDQARLAESETPYLNATFHFVLIEGGRP